MFFIQDTHKFPDFIHAVKPEPQIRITYLSKRSNSHSILAILIPGINFSNSPIFYRIYFSIKKQK
ncbi:catalase [Sodalis-like endosymbiont of Proechinophthirus fluctus]|uniref:catalase n=1 Tax=Sodalis-like endosymbiont of Proechinophthirus fluctus TaxID=1462730 RepID=UPI00093EDCA0